MRTLVVIPTYNEAESIGALVEQVLAADQAIDALVVDDGSPDGPPTSCGRRWPANRGCTCWSGRPKKG